MSLINSSLLLYNSQYTLDLKIEEEQFCIYFLLWNKGLTIKAQVYFYLAWMARIPLILHLIPEINFNESAEKLGIIYTKKHYF